MRQLTFRQDKTLRRRIGVLSPKGVNFHGYIRDRRAYYLDGIELTDAEARMLMRSTKQLMRDVGKPRELRRPHAVGRLGDRSFNLVGDCMVDSYGRTIRQHPEIAETAFELGRQADPRGRTKH